MFRTVSPEQAGISSRKVALYLKDLNQRGAVCHSLLLMKGKDIFAEFYWKPFHRDYCHRMYSDTKSFVSLAIGLLIEEGKLALSDRIVDLFPEKLDAPRSDALSRQTVEHMLTMQTCIHCPNWFTAGDPDRVHLYMNAPCLPYEPGLIFRYDSPGSQVLCALVEKLAGMPLLDYLKEKLFSPMGCFTSARILRTPNGDSWGDSALLCTPRDMAACLRLVMDGGLWEGKRLMNEAYLKKATSKLVDNNETGFVTYDSHGYGYQIWKCEQDGFSFNGMGGQFAVALPKKDLILVVTGDNQGNNTAKSLIMDGFFRMIADGMEDAPLPEDPEAFGSLLQQGESLELFSLQGETRSPFAEALNGKRFLCEKNEMGIREFSLLFSKDGTSGAFSYVNAQGEKLLPFGLSYNIFSKFPQLGYSDEVGGIPAEEESFRYDCAASAVWAEEKKLLLKVQIVDRYFGNLFLRFSFCHRGAAVVMTKTAEAFLNEYKGTLWAVPAP